MWKSIHVPRGSEMEASSCRECKLEGQRGSHSEQAGADAGRQDALAQRDEDKQRETEKVRQAEKERERERRRDEREEDREKE